MNAEKLRVWLLQADRHAYLAGHGGAGVHQEAAAGPILRAGGEDHVRHHARQVRSFTSASVPSVVKKSFGKKNLLVN
jgi:hypothetical protein